MGGRRRFFRRQEDNIGNYAPEGFVTEDGPAWDCESETAVIMRAQCPGEDSEYREFAIPIAQEPNDAWESLRPLYFALKVQWALEQCRNYFR